MENKVFIHYFLYKWIMKIYISILQSLSFPTIFFTASLSDNVVDHQIIPFSVISQVFF